MSYSEISPLLDSISDSHTRLELTGTLAGLLRAGVVWPSLSLLCPVFQFLGSVTFCFSVLYCTVLYCTLLYYLIWALVLARVTGLQAAGLPVYCCPM